MIIVLLVLVGISVELQLSMFHKQQLNKQIMLIDNGRINVPFQVELNDDNQCGVQKSYVLGQDQNQFILMIEKFIGNIDIAINNENELDNSYSRKLNSSNISSSVQFDYNFTCVENIQDYKDYQNKFSILLYPDHQQPYLLNIYKQCKTIPVLEYMAEETSLYYLVVLVVVVFCVSGKQKIVKMNEEQQQQQNQESSKKYIIIVVMACAALLTSLYLLVEQIQTVLLVLVCVFAFGLMEIFLQDMLRQVIDDEVVINHSMVGSYKRSDIFSCFISIILLVYYVQHRDWVSNNMIGCLVILGVQKTIQFNNFKQAVILLYLATLYDVFWVFVCPLLIQQNVIKLMYFRWKQIQVVVSTCLSNYYGQLVSRLLTIVVVWLDYKISQFLGCCCHFVAQYYWCCVVSYIGSLVLSILMAQLLQTPQSGLFYIVPFMSYYVYRRARHNNEVNLLIQGLSKSRLENSYQKVNPDSKDIELQSDDQGFVGVDI